jgi:RNA-directed DNA polymerase
MIRPYHTTPGKRVIKNFKHRIHEYNANSSYYHTTQDDKKQFLSSINSYLGILRQHQSYKIRKSCLSRLQGPWKNHLFYDKDFKKIAVISSSGSLFNIK